MSKLLKVNVLGIENTTFQAIPGWNLVDLRHFFSPLYYKIRNNFLCRKWSSYQTSSSYINKKLKSVFAEILINWVVVKEKLHIQKNIYNLSMLLKHYFESHLINDAINIINNLHQLNIMVPYAYIIVLYHSVTILWEIYVIRRICPLMWMRFYFKHMLIRDLVKRFWYRVEHMS